MASANFAYIVFVSSAFLLVVQLARVQLTPGIIAVVLQDLVPEQWLTNCC
jgi:hypothetical protein